MGRAGRQMVAAGAVWLVAMASAHAAVEQQDVRKALDQVLHALPPMQRYQVGVVIRPAPAPQFSNDTTALREAIIAAGRDNPAVDRVVTLDDPQMASSTPDIALAQDAGSHGMDCLVVVRVVVDGGDGQPGAWLVLYDPRGAELSRAWCPLGRRMAHVVTQPPPDNAPAATHPAEPLEGPGPSNWLRRADLAALSGGLLGGAGLLAASLAMGVMGLALVGSADSATAGVADTTVRQTLSDSMSGLGALMCLSSCPCACSGCCLGTAGLTWFWARAPLRRRPRTGVGLGYAPSGVVVVNPRPYPPYPYAYDDDDDDGEAHHGHAHRPHGRSGDPEPAPASPSPSYRPHTSQPRRQQGTNAHHGPQRVEPPRSNQGGRGPAHVPAPANKEEEEKKKKDKKKKEEQRRAPMLRPGR